MEEMNPPTRTTTKWSPFVFGTIAGLGPWIVIFTYFFGGGNYAQIPKFVYGILFGYFLFFNTFPINMVLQYMGYGKWKEYRYASARVRARACALCFVCAKACAKVCVRVHARCVLCVCCGVGRFHEGGKILRRL